jgi:hypothetical protein
MGAALFLAVGSSPVLAQVEKLAGRFPPATEAALRAILDSASARQVAVAPLTQRALEGASRGIDPERIVSVVHGLYTRLHIARRSLGESASEAELMAAASALYMGVSPDVLERIHRTSHEGKSALRLVVLTDMMDRGVPRDTATSIILSLSDADVPDESLQLLRQSMLLDINSGVAPALAARTRARGVLAEHAREKRVPGPSPHRP